MRALRAITRLAAMSTVTLAAYMALRLWRIAAARKISRARWQSRVLRHWARATCTILGIRIESSGPHPGPPFLLVSNHLGYIDIAVLASQLDCVFVAKREVANWPIIGHLCRQVGTIFIDREHRSDVMRANALIEQAIDQSRGVVLFPEGTSSRGSEVLRFRSSLLEIAARRDIPVNYAAIRYEAEDCDPPADQSVCWWGDMKFCSHFYRLMGLRGIRAALVFGARPMRSRERKALAWRLWFAVNNLFVTTTRREVRQSPRRFASGAAFDQEGECNAATR